MNNSPTPRDEALQCAREMVEGHFPHHREYKAAALALELEREVAELREALATFHAIVWKWRDDGDYPDLDGLSAAVDRAEKLLKSPPAQGGV